MNRINRSMTTRFLAAGLVSVAGHAASAAACDKEEVAHAGHPGIHARITRHDHHPAGMARLIRVGNENDDQSEHTWSDGKTELRLLRDDGVTKLFFNGDEVMSLSDEELLGAENIKVIRELSQLHDMPELRQLRQRLGALGMRAPGAPMPPLPPGAPMPPGAGGQQPRVMIGVTMQTPDEDAQLPGGANPSESTLVTSVIDGLPADAAGLEEGDIVIRINGQTPAGPDEIRQAIRDKQPGDTIKLQIVRDGDEKEIAIKLAAFEPGRLGAGARNWRSAEDEDHANSAGEVTEQISKLSMRMDELGRQMSKASGKEREQLAEEMAELAEELGERSAELAQLAAEQDFIAPFEGQFRWNRGPLVEIERGRPGEAPRAFLFRTEPPTGQGSAQTAPDQRLEKVDERLERLEKMIEKLVEEKERSDR